MIAVAPSRELLLQTAQQIPASPQVLMLLNELLTDVNSGLDEVARLLRRDTALAARIIRISNSVAFGMGGVATIEEAVNRVGYAEIYRLTGLATAAQLADLHLNAYGISGPQLRDNTLVIALTCEALATRIGVDPRVAYTAGLLRSSGKLVLDRYAKRTGKAITPLHQSGVGNIVFWEQSTFGCANSEAAGIVLNAWRFPEPIVAPVRNQYLNTSPDGDEGVSWTLLRAACAAAHEMGFALIGEHDCWSVPSAALREIGLEPSLVREASDEAKIAFEGIKGSL